MLETDLFGSLIVNLMENARRAIHSRRKQETAFVDWDFIRITSQMTDTGYTLAVPILIYDEMVYFNRL